MISVTAIRERSVAVAVTLTVGAVLTAAGAAGLFAQWRQDSAARATDGARLASVVDTAFETPSPDRTFDRTAVTVRLLVPAAAGAAPYRPAIVVTVTILPEAAGGERLLGI